MAFIRRQVCENNTPERTGESIIEWHATFGTGDFSSAGADF
jgi:hypothetical protein